jgi:hypothetical protein
LRVRVMVLNVTFKNISMEETGVPRETKRKKEIMLEFELNLKLEQTD